jgi:hypothetical protein
VIVNLYTLSLLFFKDKVTFNYITILKPREPLFTNTIKSQTFFVS